MLNPLSTLIPGTIPFSNNNSTKFLPSLLVCLVVSSWKMTPEMNYSSPGDVSSISLYRLRFSGLFSSPNGLNFLSTEPGDSSAARMPFPGVQIFLAVSINSLEKSFAYI